MSIKFFHEYKHLLQENYVEYKHIYFFSKCNSTQEVYWKLTKVMVKKYVCIPRTFLVINACNQGKALCSPCITLYMLHYDPRHVSSSILLIFRRKNCITSASGIVTLCKRSYRHTVRPFTESDDTGCCNNTGCFKKSFTTLKAYRNLYRGHTQGFELSKCSKTHRVLPRIVMVQCDFHW